MKMDVKLYCHWMFLLCSVPVVSVHAQQLSPVDLRNLLEQNQQDLSIDLVDFREFEIKDQYVSSHTGVRHIYVRQWHDDIPVYNGLLNLNLVEGRLVSFGDRTIKNIHNQSLQDFQLISPDEALGSAISELDLKEDKIPPRSFTEVNGRNVTNKVKFSPGNLSKREIPVELFWLAENRKGAKPIWIVEIEMVDEPDYWHICIDARSGEFIQKVPLTIQCSFNPTLHHNHTEEDKDDTLIDSSTAIRQSLTDTTYTVFDIPLQSPNHGNRSVVSNPWNRNGSGHPAGSHGWHFDGSSFYNNTRGNNVFAYQDRFNLGFGFSPTASNYHFDFPLNFNLTPQQNRSASITNLFFWNNIGHDVFYHYGFDEVAGNYQIDNLGRGGLGGDYVRAEGMDGGGLDNANFTITPDGETGKMQMYLWSDQNIPPYGTITPDGDYDSGIILHEYGHGISTRLTGGPSSHLCLSNNEQMGEGWSDYLALMVTTNWNYASSTDPRGIGSYVLGEDTSGTGVRSYPYTTDIIVNPLTYADVASSGGSVHAIGTVWASMLWDMTWEIIAVEGVDPDVYHGAGGNNIALLLVMEGMKLQPCLPGFVDARDAILLADRLLYEEKYKCLIWKAFARRGLGVSASQGNSFFYSDGQEAFDQPNRISIKQVATQDTISEKTPISLSYEVSCECQDHMDVEIKIKPSEQLVYVPNSGGNYQNDTVFFGPFDILCGDTTLISFDVEADCYTSFDSATVVSDEVEGTHTLVAQLIMGSSVNWVLSNAQANSPTTSWYAKDLSTDNISVLQFKDSLRISGKTYLSFMHRYETEFFWDGGVVQYQIIGDSEWHDLENHFILNGYPQGIGFTGNSNDYFGPGFDQSIIDLSFLMDTTIAVRFLFSCDESVGGTGINGWYIDDLFIINESGAASLSVACFGDTTDIDYHMSFNIIPGGKSVYVDTASPGPHNGTDWIQAYKDLQDALATAQCNDTIYIAAGIYLTTDSLDRNESFILKSGISILGGFPNGGGGDTTARNPDLFPTILSGNIGDSDSTSDNAFRLIIVDSIQKDILLDGIQLSHSSTDTSGMGSIGGAIHNQGQLILKKVTLNNHLGQREGYLLYNEGLKAQLILEDVIILLENNQHISPLLNKNGALLEIKESVEIDR